MKKSKHGVIYTEAYIDIDSLIYVINKFECAAVDAVTICIDEYNRELIKNFMNSYNGKIDINYVIRNDIKSLKLLIKNSDIIILSRGNFFYDISLLSLISFHENNSSSISIATYYDEDASKCNIIKFNDEYIITMFEANDANNEGVFKDSGLYIINTQIFLELNDEYVKRLLTGYFNLVSLNAVKITAFPTVGKFINLSKFITESVNSQKAIFLDRDGTINIDKGYVYKSEDFEFIDGVPETLKYFKDMGYLLIVITNQSGVARGYYNMEDVKILHENANKILKKEFNFEIDAFYYCPHHPKKAIPKYLKDCCCRKPMPALVLKAANEFNVDLKQSIMIGDKLSDNVLIPELEFILLDKNQSLASIKTLIEGKNCIK